MYDRRHERQSTECANEVLDCRRRLDIVVDQLEYLVRSGAPLDVVLSKISEVKGIRRLIRVYGQEYTTALRAELQQMIPQECRRPVEVPSIVPGVPKAIA